MAVSACSLRMLSVHLQHLGITLVMHGMQLNGKTFHGGLQEEWLAISVCPPIRSMTVQCKFQKMLAVSTDDYSQQQEQGARHVSCDCGCMHTQQGHDHSSTIGSKYKK